MVCVWKTENSRTPERKRPSSALISSGASLWVTHMSRSLDVPHFTFARIIIALRHEAQRLIRFAKVKLLFQLSRCVCVRARTYPLWKQTLVVILTSGFNLSGYILLSLYALYESWDWEWCALVTWFRIVGIWKAQRLIPDVLKNLCAVNAKILAGEDSEKIKKLQTVSDLISSIIKYFYFTGLLLEYLA